MGKPWEDGDLYEITIFGKSTISMGHFQ